MGKRKSRAENDKTPPLSDLIRHAPQVDQPSERAESSATKPPSFFMDALKSSVKRSPLDQNHLLLSRHSRYSLGRHYSRRNSSNHSDPSPSDWKGTPPYVSKSSFKLETKDPSNFLYSEGRLRIFEKPERISSGSSSQYAVCGDVRRMECRICRKRLRKHSVIMENTISSTDLSVVAVLVCGHAYHADCLDHKTIQEDRHDPTCPLCVKQLHDA